MEKVKAQYPMLDVETNATIHTKGLEAARYKVEDNRWERRGTCVNWERLEADMRK